MNAVTIWILLVLLVIAVVVIIVVSLKEHKEVRELVERSKKFSLVADCIELSCTHFSESQDLNRSYADRWLSIQKANSYLDKAHQILDDMKYKEQK